MICSKTKGLGTQFFNVDKPMGIISVNIKQTLLIMPRQDQDPKLKRTRRVDFRTENGFGPEAYDLLFYYMPVGVLKRIFKRDK